MKGVVAIKQKRIWIVLILLNLLWIFGNSALTGDQSNALSSGLMAFLRRLIGLGDVPVSDDPLFWGLSATGILRKCAHFGEYCALGVWFSLLWRDLQAQVKWQLLALAGLATPLIDETIQIFSGRTAAIYDVWIDFGGFTCGVALTALIGAWRRRRRQ